MWGVGACQKYTTTTKIQHITTSDMLYVLDTYMFHQCPEKYFIVGDHPQGISQRGLGLFVNTPEEL